MAPPRLLHPLRALTERGHQSVYSNGPAPATDRNHELAGAPASMVELEALGKDSTGSLKRASLDVELLAPRSPMGKETMLTFSSTPPGATPTLSGLVGVEAQPDDLRRASQPVQWRLRGGQVPQEPSESQQLLSERKQTETPEPSSRREHPNLNATDTEKGGSQIPRFQATGQLGGAPPSGAKAVVTPRPAQMLEAERPPVSPKSALTRAKWLEIRERTQGSTQPRRRQVIAVSRLEGLHQPESTTTCSTTSSIYHPPDQPRQGSGHEPSAPDSLAKPQLPLGALRSSLD